MLKGCKKNREAEIKKRISKVFKSQDFSSPTKFHSITSIMKNAFKTEPSILVLKQLHISLLRPELSDNLLT